MTTTPTAVRTLNTGSGHVAALVRTLGGLDPDLPRLRRWAATLAPVLEGGGLVHLLCSFLDVEVGCSEPAPS